MVEEKPYHLVELKALGELSLGVYCSVVGDQDMVCEMGFLLYISQYIDQKCH